VHAERVRGGAELLGRAPVQLDVGSEPGRIAADDGEHDRQAVPGGAHDRLRGAADADPGGDPTCLGLGVDVGVDQRRAQLTGPADRLLVEELHEQLELLLEQPLVVDQVVAEEREALGEGAAPHDDLDPAGGDALERGEPLVDPDRVVAAQHGDSGADPHPRRTSCDRGEHDLRSGDRVLRAVVLTDREDVDAELVGQHGLLDDLPDGGTVRQALPVVVGRDVAEGVEAELHGGHERCPSMSHGRDPLEPSSTLRCSSRTGL
jgi:hypothetical protein